MTLLTGHGTLGKSRTLQTSSSSRVKGWRVCWKSSAIYGLDEPQYSGRLPRWHGGKQSICQCRRCNSCGFDPWVGKILWSRKRQSAPVLSFGKIPWTEELGRLWFMEVQRAEHNWTTQHTHTHTYTQYSGEASQRRLALREELRFRITRKKKEWGYFTLAQEQSKAIWAETHKLNSWVSAFKSMAGSVGEACCID